MSSNFQAEMEIAMKAVHRASIMTKNVMNGIESLDKSDASPVTMADFAAQALLIHAIHTKFPGDRFIAEESADMLRGNKSLLAQVWDLVSTANASVEAYSNELSIPEDQHEMMETIDLGSKGETPTSGRVWILDPVDGTATFMKGQQYAVCLSLTIDGKEQLGILGCPNLKPDQNQVEEDLTDRDGYGVMLYAELDKGAFVVPMSKNGLGTVQPVKRTAQHTAITDIQFTDSRKSSHVDGAAHQKVFQKLQLKTKSNDLWSMQMKYIALAMGTCGAMIRIRRDKSMRASVWDHAGGQLIYTEAGGKVTACDGTQFNFAQGREFLPNWGLIAADPWAYDVIFKAVQDVLEEEHRL